MTRIHDFPPAMPEPGPELLPARAQRRAPARHLRLPGALLALVLALATAHGTAAAAGTPYKLDLYRPGDFVSQSNDVQCIGASIQMMLNMIGPVDDRTAARQLELQELARSFSPRWSSQLHLGPERQRRGASSRGWVAGLRVSGAGSYRLASAPTLEDAIAMAARAIRVTNRPVGLLVWRGAHAWVMSGFEATADPLADPAAKVTAVFVQDPWYPRISRTWGRSPEPGSRIALSDLREDFVQWGRRKRVSVNTGRFVVVLPYERVVSSRGFNTFLL